MSTLGKFFEKGLHLGVLDKLM